ncbi:MAG: hypothetical protein RSA41_07050 [Christensenella sp.]
MKEYNIEETEKVCANCIYFKQHYGKLRENEQGYYNGYFTLNCGHCIFPRLKARKPSDTCKSFETANIIKEIGQRAEVAK